MSRRPPDCSPIRGDIPRLLTEVYVKSLRERVGPISTTCARFLYVITRALSTARRGLTALEVGTGLGYSALWIGFGMLDSGFPGKLYTIEVKEERAREARENVAIAGLSDYVEVLCGRTLQLLSSLNVKLDMAFFDTGGCGYLEYLRLISPKMPIGSVLMAHDVVGPFPQEAADFLEEITLLGPWMTVVLPVDQHGLSFSIKIGEKRLRRLEDLTLERIEPP